MERGGGGGGGGFKRNQPPGSGGKQRFGTRSVSQAAAGGGGGGGGGPAATPTGGRRSPRPGRSVSPVSGSGPGRRQGGAKRSDDDPLRHIPSVQQLLHDDPAATAAPPPPPPPPPQTAESLANHTPAAQQQHLWHGHNATPAGSDWHEAHAPGGPGAFAATGSLGGGDPASSTALLRGPPQGEGEEPAKVSGTLQNIYSLRKQLDELHDAHKREELQLIHSMKHMIEASQSEKFQLTDLIEGAEARLQQEKVEKEQAVSLYHQFKDQGDSIIRSLSSTLTDLQKKYAEDGNRCVFLQNEVIRLQQEVRAEHQQRAALENKLAQQQLALSNLSGDVITPSAAAKPQQQQQPQLPTNTSRLQELIREKDAALVRLENRVATLQNAASAHGGGGGGGDAAFAVERELLKEDAEHWKKKCELLMLDAQQRSASASGGGGGGGGGGDVVELREQAEYWKAQCEQLGRGLTEKLGECETVMREQDEQLQRTQAELSAKAAQVRQLEDRLGLAASDLSPPDYEAARAAAAALSSSDPTAAAKDNRQLASLMESAVVKMLVEQLKSEKRQRLEIEEQGDRMLLETSKQVAALEQRVKNAEGTGAPADRDRTRLHRRSEFSTGGGAAAARHALLPASARLLPTPGKTREDAAAAAAVAEAAALAAWQPAPDSSPETTTTTTTAAASAAAAAAAVERAQQQQQREQQQIDLRAGSLAATAAASATVPATLGRRDRSLPLPYEAESHDLLAGVGGFDDASDDGDGGAYESDGSDSIAETLRKWERVRKASPSRDRAAVAASSSSAAAGLLRRPSAPSREHSGSAATYTPSTPSASPPLSAASHPHPGAAVREGPGSVGGATARDTGLLKRLKRHLDEPADKKSTARRGDDAVRSEETPAAAEVGGGKGSEATSSATAAAAAPTVSVPPAATTAAAGAAATPSVKAPPVLPQSPSPTKGCNDRVRELERLLEEISSDFKSL